MKNLFLMLIFLSSFLKAQSLVHNDRLLTQLTKNQAVRMTSNQVFLDSYKKQKETYDKINEKLVQINSINTLIFKQLTNVDSAIKQGKQLVYISRYFEKIATASSEMLQLTAQYPQYSVLIYKTYERVFTNVTKLYEELHNEILKEDNNYLMNPYDRQAQISHLNSRLRLIFGTIVSINSYLKRAKTKPYLYQIPALKTYVNMDKGIVEQIMIKWKLLN